jgi:hypothetical protein
LADFPVPPVLADTKSLPFRQQQNTIGMLLVNTTTLQNTYYAVLIITKAMPLVFYQAPEVRGGFLIIDQLQLACI